MKNWTALLLYGALCVTALLSALTTVLVLSSAFLPVDDWLQKTAAQSRAVWRKHPMRTRLAKAQRKLWRRLDALLQGEGVRLHEMALLDGEDREQEDDDEEMDFGVDSDSDDDCVGVYTDWKHGRICAITR